MPLTYPVDTTKRYCIWNTVTNAPHMGLANVKWPNPAGEPSPHASPNLEHLLVVRNPAPAPSDPSTHKMVREFIPDLLASTYVETWKEVELTPQEIARREDTAARERKAGNVSSSIDTLRAWADQAKNTTVTSQNAVATLQVVSNRLGRFFDHFADLVEGQRLDQ